MAKDRPGVQSAARALGVLEAIANAGGEAGLGEVADALDLPVPTAHRFLRTLVELGYVRQVPSRRYALGPPLIRLGEQAARLLSAWALPALVSLEDRVHETANLAVLDATMVSYVAQVPSRHFMRMFTEVGRRVHPHSTGVGKAILAGLDDDEVRSILRHNGMPAMTSSTIVDETGLLDELVHVRDRGYAIDEGEQELSVRCIAVAVAGPPSPMAVSVSGPASRLGPAEEDRAVAALRDAADALRVVIMGTEDPAPAPAPS